MLGFLGDLLGLNKGEGTKTAATQNKGAIAGYDIKGNAIIDAGSAKAGSYLDQVAGLYDGQIGRGQQGTALYDDAMGLNGAAGNARAMSSYASSPGQEYALNQGLQALDRRRSAAGSFQSGGADADTISFATGTANQNYGDWLTRLSGYNGITDAGIAGKAGGLNNLANLATGTASQKLDLAGNVVSGNMNANNLYAKGVEANKAGIADLGSNLLGMAAGKLGWGGFK